LRIAVIVEAIPPFCGGGEQVAWIHATEMASRHVVTVITFGEQRESSARDGIRLELLPKPQRPLTRYCTTHRSLLQSCIEQVDPAIIHCHMPNVLSLCFRRRNRLLVHTIHDGTPENEMLGAKFGSRRKWARFKVVRRLNMARADAVTCVSRHNLEVMRGLYPAHAHKMHFVPNPIYDRYFQAPSRGGEDYVLNFGRQISHKMAALLEAAKLMPELRFVFVGSGEMVRDHGVRNAEFFGFSAEVERFIDGAAMCVFPSSTENFPLVGLEAMARGKPVIASRRGFSEYIEHMKNGFLLDSIDPNEVVSAIRKLQCDADLRRRLGRAGRLTAEQFRPVAVVEKYEQLYESLGLREG